MKKGDLETTIMGKYIITAPQNSFPVSPFILVSHKKRQFKDGKRSLLSAMRKWQKGFCTIFVSKTFDVIHLSPVTLSQKIAQRGISRIHCMFSLSFLWIFDFLKCYARLIPAVNLSSVKTLKHVCPTSSHRLH